MASKTKIAVFILLGIVILFAALIGGIMLVSAGEPAALLSLDNSAAQVFHKGQWTAGVDEQELYAGDKVKTGAGASVSIIFYDSVITRLEESTEVTITSLSKEKVAVSQTAGETWNRFEKIAGVQNLEVQTPSAVATVRGTGFLMSLEEILVEEGIVDAAPIKDGKKAEAKGIGAGQSVHMDPATLQMVIGQMNPEQKAKVAKHLSKDIDALDKLRMRIIMRDPMAKPLMKQYKVTDEKIQQTKDKVDKGEIDERAMLEKSPYKPPYAEKVLKINQLIRERKKALAQMR